MNQQAHPDQAGWHPDPAERFDSRYWDGHAWTRAVMRDGQVDTDPEYVPPTTVVQTGDLQPIFVQNAGAPSIPPQSAKRRRSVPWGQAPPSPATADRFTSLAPEEAQSRLAQMLAVSGIALTETAPGTLSATVTIAGEPNWILVVALCFIWLVPGIVYWYMNSRPVPYPLSLRFLATELGTHIVVDGDPRALERLAPALTQLPW